MRRFCEVCGTNCPKFPLGTKFCGFLFKQQDYFQLLSLVGNKPALIEIGWKKCGIFEALSPAQTIEQSWIEHSNFA